MTTSSVDTRPIGGYFELELTPNAFLHDDAILLNSARNCFAYLLEAKKPTKVYIPTFTCDVMLEPLQKLDIPFVFYAINDRLELAKSIDVQPNDMLVYTNYFGVKDRYVRQLQDIYGASLVVDCSQAYYFEPSDNMNVFFSPRKFFGVSDGGCLYTPDTVHQQFDTDVSYDRFSHLIKRYELGPQAGFADFKSNDASLEGQPIKHMSALTRGILGTIDFQKAKQIRNQNAQYLHAAFKDINGLAVDISDNTCPMVYPLLLPEADIRNALIADDIFVATYWPNIFQWCQPNEVEYRLAEKLLPLPIDQRYTIGDMDRIIKVIKESL